MIPKLIAEIPAAHEYDFWYQRTLVNYARDKERANGLTPSEAKELAEGTMARLLAKGVDTPDQYLRVLKAGGQLIGFYWLAAIGKPGNRKGFIYDIVIEDEQQGKGFGRAAMLLIEKQACELNLKSVGLHVFAFNERAIGLYRSLNYEVTDLVMEKSLEKSRNDVGE